MLLAILFFIFLYNFSFAKETDYLEYADIPWTDTINFNGEADWNNYEVRINTWVVDYVTWSDWKIHNCFPLIWTWYTNKLWEIYFSYNWIWSYICDDYKLRWLFKIWAWGRWHMEDLENNPEKWKCYLDNFPTDWYYYHNADPNWSWTWQARLDDIWYANFNSAKTAFDLKKAFDWVKITAIVSNVNNKIANWADTWEITITATYIWSWWQTYFLKNFSFQNIKFITWTNSDIQINWNKSPWFKYNWNLTTNNNWILTGIIYLYHPWKNLEYKLELKVSNNISLYTTWNTFSASILPPYQINLDLTWKETNKIFINYLDSIKTDTTSDPNINNLSFSNTTSEIDLWNYLSYFQPVKTGENINFSDVYQDIEINYKDPTIAFYSGDVLPLRYYYKTNYSFKLNWNTFFIENYTWYTNFWYMFKNWLVKSIEIAKDSDQVIADWKTPFIYKIKFLTEKKYPINHLDFNVSLNDFNKFFNLTWNNDTYIKWYFVITWDTQADTKWIYNIWIISYKPIPYNLNAFLTWFVKDIKYNWHYSINSTDKYLVLNNLVFTNIANLSLEDKTININKETDINANYISWSNTTNWKYKLTWYIFDCPDCGFKEWKVLSSNDFWEKTFTIYITWWNDPSKLIYSWYLSYYLDWNYWNKQVYIPYQKEYDSFLYIWWWSVQIIWNVVSDKKIIWRKSFISTIINPIYFKNRLRKKIFTSIIRGNNFIKVNSTKSVDLSLLTWNKIYECINPNIIVTLYGNYNKNINIYFINCQINITSDILPTSLNKNLSIISLNKNYKTINFENSNWWNIPGNIYIWPNVKTIKANIITDWSIFTYANWNLQLDSSSIFLENRWTNTNLKKQLFIWWKVFSRNTLWWWLQNSQNEYTIIWGKKVISSIYLFWDISASSVAKWYDIWFWRNNFVKSDWTYDTGNLSQVIYNKYKCTWDTSTDKYKICSKSVIIMDSNDLLK